MSGRESAPRQMTMVWGTRTISYVLRIEARRNLVIEVHPDSRVHVRAPGARPLEHVVKRVHARRSWIARQLREFERLSPLPPPRFISGETLSYLGREYRLRIKREVGSVSLQAGRLVVCVPRMAGGKAVQASVHEWYGGRAREVFGARMRCLQREIALLTGIQALMRIRPMARRWGSCTARGTITMNPALMQAPRACVDYVLVHELVHVLEPSHSPKFYRLLDRAMPDWRTRRARLALAALRWN